MSDPRFFAKIDVGYFDNPKVGSVLDDHPLGVVFHLRAILYCRQHLTDGVFPVKFVARMVGASWCGEQCLEHCREQCDVCAVADAGLIQWSGGQAKATVHDFLKHQDSAEDVARRKDRGRKGARGRWSSKDSNTDAASNATSTNTDASSTATSTAASNAQDSNKQCRGEERRGEIYSAATAPPTSPQAGDDNATTGGHLIELPPPAKPKTRRRRTAVPDDYAPTIDMTQAATQEHPAIAALTQTQRTQWFEAERLRFIRHWQGKGELRASWDATWRNWISRAVEYNPPKPTEQATDPYANYSAF